MSKKKRVVAVFEVPDWATAFGTPTMYYSGHGIRETAKVIDFRELPKPKDTFWMKSTSGIDLADPEAVGWNKCLDAITGGA